MEYLYFLPPRSGTRLDAPLTGLLVLWLVPFPLVVVVVVVVVDFVVVLVLVM